MQYKINISKDDYFENLRPSIEGLDNKIIERDTMDEVVAYLVSILDNNEQKQLSEIYWSYITEFEQQLCDADNIPNWKNARYGIIEFVIDEKARWKFIISECNQMLKEKYKEPTMHYIEIDE